MGSGRRRSRNRACKTILLTNTTFRQWSSLRDRLHLKTNEKLTVFLLDVQQVACCSIPAQLRIEMSGLSTLADPFFVQECLVHQDHLDTPRAQSLRMNTKPNQTLSTQLFVLTVRKHFETATAQLTHWVLPHCLTLVLLLREVVLMNSVLLLPVLMMVIMVMMNMILMVKMMTKMTTSTKLSQ